MSLRDFNAPSDERPVTLTHEPIGNGAGLSSFHTVSPEERQPNHTGKIVGALAVALMVGAGGLYLYSATSPANHPKPMATAANMPSPPPAQPAAMTTQAPDELAAIDAAPAAPVAEPEAATAPVRSAERAPAAAISEGAAVRMGADSQSTSTAATTSQQAIVTPSVPEPVSPTPSLSDLAIANPQSGVAVPSDAVTAQDIPSTAQTEAMPQAEAASPAQAQPAQSAGQVAQ